MQHRPWGTWLSKITDRDTHRRIWIGYFQSVAQAAWAYDIQVMCLYGARVRLNFPFGALMPDLAPIDPRVVSRHELRENREAYEHVEAEHDDEEYMAELRRRVSGAHRGGALAL